MAWAWLCDGVGWHVSEWAGPYGSVNTYYVIYYDTEYGHTGQYHGFLSIKSQDETAIKVTLPERATAVCRLHCV